MLTFIKNLLTAVMGAAPCWYMAMLFFKTWQTPMAVDDGRWVKLAVGIMILEFILVHSGGFLGALSQRVDITINGRPIKETHRVPLLVGMICFYLVFAAAISACFQSWMLFSMFCWITGARLLSWFLQRRESYNVTMARSAVSVVLYLSAAFLSVFVEIPPAGLTTEVLDKVYPGRGSGIWEQSPQQAILAGMFYFGVLGVWELAAPFWTGKGREQDRPAEATSQ